MTSKVICQTYEAHELELKHKFFNNEPEKPKHAAVTPLH